MRKPLIALSLSVAAAASTVAAAGAGAGAAGAAPIACPELPQDRIDAALRTTPAPFPGVAWKVTGMGGSVDCTLNWVQLETPGGTGSSPVQILLFDHNKFAGTPTPKGDAFTSVVGSNAPGQITIRFKWARPGDANANPTGRADVRFQALPQDTPQPLDPIPAEVAD